MKTILIIEDEKVIRESVAFYFIHNGYEVLTAKDGEEGLELFATNQVDLVILDIMLPKVDGWSVCRRIRKQSTTPVILLTARSDEEDTLLGFDLGADDYVTKPFKPSILLARAKRLLKAVEKLEVGANDIKLCGIHLDKSARIVTVEGEQVPLTWTEFELLRSLMEHKEQVLTRETLMVAIWGYEYIGDDKALNTHIRNLRHKLGEKAKHIATIIRVGYKFEVHTA
ncbi:response regulator transcription factor [Priestia taiwanensis]|uniref:DNA-binding response regulator n=1 Tax=Priestia taiwanensis TaxID=1347902 RepID=A0A917ENT6_9BACI|nr:response regulator transcription factor [Priestia taiwanensis]MBM7362680.1 DNA-binding response OmpR family regulator [Priestia taiwanensis]GGE64196.1 DNA-binding response regulator [Priestia taiwanensis]